MLGGIAGDIIGPFHEGGGSKQRDFPLFTPHSTFTADSVLCMAVAMTEAYFGGLPESLRRETLVRLSDDLRRVVEAF